ncbi:MAG: tRNA (guanosine(46)-N7)-methyltransferase TrmB [Eubacteriales bacterium]|nr:tRNA (guanosine(46)-N7)-methyltransferase TrmB [Eubacteriales bacterium]
MRQRKIRNLDAKLKNYDAYLIEQAEAGSWRDFFPGADKETPLAVEIGCGKGKFLTATALAHPDRCFLGIEQNESAGFHALEKADQSQIANIRFHLRAIRKEERIFETGELDRIYLNFSDPWPKARHAKRRLTAPSHLAAYEDYLKDGGILEFRTDNRDLFSYSLEQIEDRDAMEILEITTDFHASRKGQPLITTEYEDKFANAGKKICYLKVRIRKNSDLREK